MSQTQVKEEKKNVVHLEPSKEMLMAVGQIFSIIEGFNGVQRGYILSRIQDTYLKPKVNPKGAKKPAPPKEKKQATKELDATPEAKAYYSMLKALKAKYKEGLKNSSLDKLVKPDEAERYAALKEAFLAKRVEIAQRFRAEGPSKDPAEKKENRGSTPEL